MGESYSDALSVIAAASTAQTPLPPYTGAAGDYSYLRDWIVGQAAALYGVDAATFDTPTVLSTTLLRDFVHRSISFADGVTSITTIMGTPDYQGADDVGRMFRYPAQGLCGDMALQLWQVYRALGYETNYLDIVNGDVSGYTDSHVTTQVYLEDIGKFVVQDATFNYALVGADDTLLSFSEARELLLSGDAVTFEGAVNYSYYAAEGVIQSPQLSTELSDYISGNYFSVVYQWIDGSGALTGILSALFRDAASAHTPGSSQGQTFGTAEDALTLLQTILGPGKAWTDIATAVRDAGFYVSGFQTGDTSADWLTVRLVDGSYLSIRIHDLLVVPGSLDELLLESMTSPSIAALLAGRALPTLLTVDGVILPGGNPGGASETVFATVLAPDLVGGAGRDRLYGTADANRLDGGGGENYLVGGLGDDTYVVHNANDRIVERAGEGYDTVLTDVSFTLGAWVSIEALKAADAASTTVLNLTGNDLVNALTGNAGSNRLDGGAGADVMAGLAGDDVYYVDNADDQVIEAAGEGYDTIVTNVSYVLAAGVAVEVIATYGSGTTTDIDLTGNELVNTLVGNAGRNRLDGGVGADEMWGYGGDDTYVVDNAGDRIIEVAGHGYDTVLASVNYALAAGVSVEALKAADATSTVALDLTGNELVNELTGNAGSNRLDGGGGADVMAGLGGDDTYVVDSLGDQVVEADGEGFDTILTNLNYTLAAGLSVEALAALDAASTTALELTGNELSNTLTGNAGANRLDGGVGADVMSGLGGDDTYYVDDENDKVMEVDGEGYDTVITSVNYTLAPRSAVEVLRAADIAAFTPINLTGSAFSNALTGNAGDNRLDGGAGADTLTGLAGDDTYLVDNAGDQIVEVGGEGYDTVITNVSYALAAGISIEVLRTYGSSTTGNIDLTGNELANSLIGNAGNNRLDGGGGADVMEGHDGDDTYVIDDAGDQVIEVADEGFDTILTNLNYTLAAGLSIEIVAALDAASTAAQDLTGNELANTLTGNAGANRLDGGAGADVMAGLSGDDIYLIDNAGDQIVEVADEGYDSALAGVSYALAAGVSIEALKAADAASTTALDLTGNELANALTGNAGANRLDGGAGADLMAGLGGDDTYVIDNIGDQVIELDGEGYDTVLTNLNYTLAAGLSVEAFGALDAASTTALELTGNELANSLTGNAGANRLDGGAGADVMKGLGGDDTYVIDNVGDQVIEVADEGYDTVLTAIDYALAAGVSIEALSALDAASTAALALAGNELANALTGNAGANRLDGGAGADVMAGLSGDDTYIVDDLGDQVIEVPGEGYDTVLTALNYTLAAGLSIEALGALDVASTAALDLTGNELANALTGNAGANRLNGGAGADVMAGFGGDDLYYVDNAGDQVIEAAGEGYDTLITNVSYALTAGVSVELLRTYGSATTENIDLTGNEFANTLAGNSSANRLDGGAGADEMWGYGGDDTYVVDNVGDRIIEVAGQGHDTVLTSVNYALLAGVSIEALKAADAAATTALDLTGNELANALSGNAGANRLNGGAGADVMAGLGGDDIYYVDNAGDQVIEAAGEGHDTVVTCVSYSLAAGQSVEVLRTYGSSTTETVNLTGNELSNTLIGNTAANRLDGGVGADTMWGYGGDDTYLVDNAADRIVEVAGEGYDTVITNVSYTLAAGVSVELLRTYGSATTSNINLTGNELDNTLVGNSGDNILSGGAGDDTFWGYGGLDQIDGGDGQDRVVLRGAASDYVIKEIVGGYEITDLVADRDGRLLITNVEIIAYSGDGSVNTLPLPAAAMTASDPAAMIDPKGGIDPFGPHASLASEWTPLDGGMDHDVSDAAGASPLPGLSPNDWLF